MNEATQYLIDLFREFDPALIDDAPVNGITGQLPVSWLADYLRADVNQDNTIPAAIRQNADFDQLARYLLEFSKI